VGKRWASLDRLGMVWQTAASHSMSFHVCGDQRRVIVLEMGVWACTLGRWVKGTKNSAFKNPEYRLNWGNRITKPALKGGLPTAVGPLCAPPSLCAHVWQCLHVPVSADIERGCLTREWLVVAAGHSHVGAGRALQKHRLDARR